MAREKICGIYIIENRINGKVYVGQSIDIEDRWRKHKYKLKKNKHPNAHLQSSYNLNGLENFIFEIIEKCEKDKEILEQREQCWIQFFMSTDNEKGYNFCESGVSSFGWTHGEDSKKKIGDYCRGERHYLFNKKMPKETCEKMSEATKGEKHWNFGLHRSEETCKKISIANTGHKHSPETLQKLSDIQQGENAHFYGKKHKEESIQKQSAAKLGEKNPSAKLTQEKADEILMRYEKGGISQAALAREYGVSPGCVQGIVDRINWVKTRSETNA